MVNRGEGLETTLTTEQVAELFQVKVPTVYRWARDGVIPSQKIGRTLRFRRADVEAALGTEPTGLQSVPDPTPEEEDAFISILARALARELRRQGTL